MFGSNNKSLFGSTNTSSAFGQPIGQPNTSAFGVQSAQNTGPFGAMSGQQPQQSLFGSTSTQPLFGSTQTSIFGSTPNTSTANTFGGQTTTGAFGGTTSSIFGGNQQNNSLFGGNRFGATNTNTSPFGANAMSAPVSATNGTTFKFNATAGTDTMMKNGVSQNINTRHQCITCMREYESKSLEELRLEDYTANRKGPQQSTGMFGNTSGAVSSSSLFGTTSTPQNAFSSTTNTGLFGQNKSSFGTLAPTTTTSSGLFGQTFGQNKPLFGTSTSFPSSQTQVPNTSMFGSVSTSNPTLNNSFFNSGTTNTTATVKPLFGNTPTAQPQQQLFGQTNTQNASLAQKPLFGNTSSSLPQFGTNTTSLFNSGNTSNLFSSSQPSLFNTGTTSTNNSLSKPLFFSNPTSLPLNSSIGNTGITSTPSLFGNTSSAFGNTGSMFGTNSTNFNFGSTNPSFPSNNTFQQNVGLQQMSGTAQGFNAEQLVTRFQTFPYGESPQLQIDVSLPSNAKMRTKFTTDPKTLNHYKISAKTIDNKPQRFVNNSPKVSTMLFDGLEDDNSAEGKTARDVFVPRRNVKKLVFRPKNTSTMTDLSVSQKSPNNSSTFLVDLQQNSGIKFDDSIASNMTVNEFMRKDNTFVKQIDSNPSVRSGLSNPQKRDYDSTETTSQSEKGMNDSECYLITVPKCGVILTRTDYYTIPPLEELDNYYDISSDSCIVPNFTVGRQDYGSIYWNGPIDVKGLNLDEIVHIRRKEVIVYPDEEVAPTVGEGLNRSAQITLDQVWPIDKSNHELIKDSDRLRAMKYADKIEAATIKLGATFKEYRPDSGSWVFTVKHFSKYGLTDDDDEEEEEELDIQSDISLQKIPKKSIDKTQVVENTKKLFSKDLAFDSVLNDINSGVFNKSLETRDTSMHYLFDEPEEDEEEEDMFDNGIDRSFDISTQFSSKFTELDKIRSTLFDEYEDTVSKKSKTYPIVVQKESKGKIFSPIVPNISRPMVSKKRDLIFSSDTFAAENKLICDISSVCVSNSPKLMFFNGSRNFVFTKGTTVLICELNLIDLNASVVDRFEEQLKNNSIILKSSDEKTVSLVETRDFAKNSFNRLSLELLVEALYGPLTEITPYACHQQKMDRILEWLFSANKKLSIPKSSYSKIIHFLSTNELDFGVDEALHNNNPRLAAILSMGNTINKDLIISQLDSWKRSKADAFIEYNLIKIYVLMSGLIQWKLSNETIVSVVEDLQWTQQLALILLYKTPPEVDDNELGLNLLSTAISSLNVIPEEVEYHLLASNSAWVAMAWEPSILDAWFLHQSLKAFHVIHDDNQSLSDSTHSLVASQLKDIRWACFVATHIKNDDIRQTIIKEIITRNGPLIRKDMDIREWLLNKLYLPSTYLSEGLAIESKATFDYKRLALNLIDCKQWSEAHDILMEWVWPQMIINGQNDSIRQMIAKLKPNSHLISNWYSNGAHIYETYLKCVESSNIEDIKSFNIHQLRCSTKKHVLCQSEMARKVNIIFSELSGGQFAYNTPIPEDYAFIELKTNAKNLIKSFC